MLGALYATAGIAHLLIPSPFVRIVPSVLPWPEAIVLVTGVLELSGAVGLLVPRLRRSAGLMLALYALCVWPANVTHALQDIAVGFPPANLWYHLPRLALQPVLIWLALFSGGILPRQRLDGALKSLERERIHPPAHQLSDQPGRVGITPAHLRHGVQPD